MGKHFYEDDGYPQCEQRCIVKGHVCICEFVAEHDDRHERIRTTRLASVDDYERWPTFKNFVSPD